MAASIGGIDAIAFSGGIGMHAAPIRARVVEALEWLGLEVESNLNQQSTAETFCKSARVRTFVLAINEELEMADLVASLLV